jgi:23S rRNA (cytidine1920-2'-O)/16S rRNA (cytidine1409-2'-O)-methyltransferase
LLEAGAARVVALDVGRGQLDWSLRKDPRVRLLEGVNARHLEARQLPFLPSIAVVDVSFISLKLILPRVVECLEPSGEIVALVKPQFEVGKTHVGRGGIVRDVALHARVLEEIARLSDESDWGLRDFSPSEIRGAEGNQEYFVQLRPSRSGLTETEWKDRVAQITTDVCEETP